MAPPCPNWSYGAGVPGLFGEVSTAQDLMALQWRFFRFQSYTQDMPPPSHGHAEAYVNPPANNPLGPNWPRWVNHIDKRGYRLHSK